MFAMQIALPKIFNTGPQFRSFRLALLWFLAPWGKSPWGEPEKHWRVGGDYDPEAWMQPTGVHYRAERSSESLSCNSFYPDLFFIRATVIREAPCNSYFPLHTVKMIFEIQRKAKCIPRYHHWWQYLGRSLKSVHRRTIPPSATIRGWFQKVVPNKKGFYNSQESF